MFLACFPTVFLVESDYEILINTIDPGIISIGVGDKRYYPESCGVLPCMKKLAKIKVPLKELDRERAYTVYFKKTVDKKSYYPVFGQEEKEVFAFRPMEGDEINIYHIADVHYNFQAAEKTAGYFGENTDLYVFNGDLGEVNTVENYLDVCRFTGRVTGGQVPCVFARGNHDTRGALAESYTEYFPSNGRKTYYTFETDRIFGIVLDCGEDKDDGHPEYGGANLFHDYRLNETRFLEGLLPREGKLTFAVCHISPSGYRDDMGGCFHIEDDIYRKWNGELDRLGVSFMLSGHVHRSFVLDKNDARCIRPNPYPIIIGSAREKDMIVGAAITVLKDGMTVRFTDGMQRERERYRLDTEHGYFIKIKN